MLKRLGGAIIVAAFAFAGMAASAALAVQMLRPADAARKPSAPAVAGSAATVSADTEPKPARKKRAAVVRAAHPWDDACSAAKVDVDLVLATAAVAAPADVLELAREGLAINVRLYRTLRGTAGGGAVGRSFLARLERSIVADRKGLARFERSTTARELDRWIAASRRDNAALRGLAARMDAPACAAYFTG